MCREADFGRCTTLSDRGKVRDQQLLLKQMLQFHERDRKLIAYEIHDGLVQDATAAQMLLYSLLKTAICRKANLRTTIQEASS